MPVIISNIKYCLFLFIAGIFIYSCTEDDDKLLIFAGSVSKPATEEFAEIFENETGIKTEIIFGGSGFVLSQMIMSNKGDIYFPGSSDYMEIAKQKDIVFEETEHAICYLVPAINVKKGNPKGIKSLKDLLRNDVRIAIANPDGVCVGIYAVEIIESNLSEEERDLFQKKLLNYTGSCSNTATVITLETVDAVIGWRVFQNWENTDIETITFDKSEIVRIGFMPIAISKLSKKRENAEKFIESMNSKKGKEIFKKYGYFVSQQEAFDFIGEEKPVGGNYIVDDKWKVKYKE